MLFQCDAETLRDPVDEVEVGGNSGGIVDAGIGNPGGTQADNVALGHLLRTGGELQRVVDQSPLPRFEGSAGRIAP